MTKGVMGLDDVGMMVVKIIAKRDNQNIDTDAFADLLSKLVECARTSGYEAGFTAGKAAGWDEALAQGHRAAGTRKQRTVLNTVARSELLEKMVAAAEGNAGELPVGTIRRMADEYGVSKTYVRTIYAKHKAAPLQHRKLPLERGKLGK